MLSHKLHNVMESAYRSQSMWILWKQTRSSSNIHYTKQHGTQSNPHTNQDKQLHSIKHIQHHHETKTVQVHGHVFLWIKDRVQQEQFIIYRHPRTENIADYFTKHHLEMHHWHIKDIYIQPSNHGSKYTLTNEPSALQRHFNTCPVCITKAALKALLLSSKPTA